VIIKKLFRGYNAYDWLRKAYVRDFKVFVYVRKSTKYPDSRAKGECQISLSRDKRYFCIESVEWLKATYSSIKSFESLKKLAMNSLNWRPVREDE